MEINSVNNAIETCKTHIQKTQSEGTEIEAYLTRYLLIVICANFEEEIRKLVIERASMGNDNVLRSYVEASLPNVFRGLKLKELKGLLNKFGTEYKEGFKNMLASNDDRIGTFYSSIITQRNDFAHTCEANITFNELIMYYQQAHKVLDMFSQSLLGV